MLHVFFLLGKAKPVQEKGNYFYLFCCNMTTYSFHRIPIIFIYIYFFSCEGEDKPV